MMPLEPAPVLTPTPVAAPVPAPPAMLAPGVPAVPPAPVAPPVPVAEPTTIGIVTPAPVAPPHDADTFTTVPKHVLDDYYQTKAQLATFQAEQRRAADELSRQQALALAQQGQYENALKMREEEAKKALEAERIQKLEIEQRARNYALTGELSRALASQPLVDGGVEQLAELWSKNFSAEVDPTTNQYTVRTRDYKSPAQFVAEQLASHRFSHFLRPTTAGGVGAPGASQSAPTVPSPQQQQQQTGLPVSTPRPEPTTGGEYLMRMMENQKRNMVDPLMVSGTVDERGIIKPTATGAVGLRRIDRAG